MRLPAKPRRRPAGHSAPQDTASTCTEGEAVQVAARLRSTRRGFNTQRERRPARRCGCRRTGEGYRPRHSRRGPESWTVGVEPREHIHFGCHKTYTSSLVSHHIIQAVADNPSRGSTVRYLTNIILF